MLEIVRRARFLDPKLFTAFAAAAELENFTRAAQVARMTQSGVSQHIAKLEEQVGRPLFNRNGNKVLLTPAGKALQKYLQGQVADLDAFFDYLQAEEVALAGVVSYAMPPSCLLSDHFGELLAKRIRQPQLRLKVTLASSPDVLEMVQQNAIDFGFLTLRPESPSIRFRSFCQEEYLLVSSNAQLARSMKAEDIFEHPVIGYPGADVYYNMWIRHHLPNESRDYHSLVRSGDINSLDGAITMVAGGLGNAVFPRHCVQTKLNEAKIFGFAGRVPPLLNTIYVATLADARLPRRATQVIDWFYEMLENSAVAAAKRPIPPRAAVDLNRQRAT
jgi:DNA-binding transcriptional LysR family regulator